jgi:uncharacterized membrane protein
MKATASITIDAPIERVWDVISDVERWHEWTASITSVERLDHGPFTVGSSARIRQPRLATMVWTVTDIQPGRSFTWQAQAGGMTSVGEHVITPGPGASVTATLSASGSGFLEPLVSLFYKRLAQRYVDLEAAGLKRRSEARVLAASAA